MARLRVIGATVLLYLGTQLAVGMADPAMSVSGGSGELASLNAEILRQPNDTTLNLRYAALAEQLGKPRLALTAYERILVYDPQNQAALAGVLGAIYCSTEPAALPMAASVSRRAPRRSAALNNASLVENVL